MNSEKVQQDASTLFGSRVDNVILEAQLTQVQSFETLLRYLNQGCDSFFTISALAISISMYIPS